jgi:RNA polymerase sigma-70 factor (ECF subfamily)
MLYGLLGFSFFLGTLAPAPAPGPATDGDADLALLAQVVRGQPAAVRVVARRLLPVIQARVRRALRRLTPAHLGDADDVVQKIWLVLLKDGGRQLLAYDPTRGVSLEAYVGMISEREVRNHIQHEAASSRRPPAGHASLDEAGEVAASRPDPEAEVVSADLAARLDAHLALALGPKGVAILRLVYGDGCAPEQAARSLGCNLQVVYNWQHRIRTLARAFIAERDGDGDAAARRTTPA